MVNFFLHFVQKTKQIEKKCKKNYINSIDFYHNILYSNSGHWKSLAQYDVFLTPTTVETLGKGAGYVGKKK